MSKQIVHIIVGLNQGGAEQSLARLVRDGGDEHTIICFGFPTPLSEEILACGSLIHFFPLVPSGLWQARQLLRTLQPSIVQGWMYYGNFLASLIFLSSCKVAWNIRSTMSRNYPFKIRSVIGLSRFMSPDLVLYNARAVRASHPFFNKGSPRSFLTASTRNSIRQTKH